MRKETVSALCAQCIDRIQRYGTRACIENLAATFTEKARNGDYDALSDEDPFGYGGEPFASRRPAEIRDAVARRVLGQPEAVKAAALIVYNQLAGRRTNAVFCGPSGCGKSEIWRTLSTEYPGLVRMMDFSRFAADGWRGSLHVRDIFEGIDPDDVRRSGLIVVMDEADKIVCEHAVGAGGTDYHALLQNNLLKIMDGDEIEFGDGENKKSALAVDCSKVSVVMLGAFEHLMDGKARDAKHIGFGSAPGAALRGRLQIHTDGPGAGGHPEGAGVRGRH